MAIGQKFGKLTQVGEAFHHAKNRSKSAVFLCDCGNRIVSHYDNVRVGKRKSCGCSRYETPPNYKHGMAKSLTHKAWLAMRQRCSRTAKCRQWYYEKGVVVCRAWDESFSAFIADVGERPTKRHTLDRIDPKGNYEPGNCRWVTQREQMRNTCKTRMLTFRGESLCLADMASKYGMSKQTLARRLDHLGMSLEQALLTPVRRAKA